MYLTVQPTSQHSPGYVVVHHPKLTLFKLCIAGTISAVFPIRYYQVRPTARRVLPLLMNHQLLRAPASLDNLNAYFACFIAGYVDKDGFFLYPASKANLVAAVLIGSSLVIASVETDCCRT
jgi:hypothetical protein